jgi:hypothetical protein
MHRFLLFGLLATAGCSTAPQIKQVEVPQDAPERANVGKSFLVTGIIQVCEKPGVDRPGCEYVTKDKDLLVLDVTSDATFAGSATYSGLTYYKVLYSDGRIGYVMAQALNAQATAKATPPAASAKQAMATATQAKPAKQTTARADPRDPNEANRRLMALSEKDRRSMFYVTLNTSGERCPEVTRTFYQGSAKPSWNALWNVECRDGPSYSIMIMSDEKGSTKVMTCGELRVMGGGECFTRPPQ